MSAETYQMISMIAFICGGIFTLIAVILFIKFDIPVLIGELSGRTAEKKVQEIREQNRQAVSMRQHGLERRKRVAMYDVVMDKSQEKMPVQKDESTSVLNEPVEMKDDETELLEEGTMMLEESTTVLNEETTMLEESTTVLEEGTNMLNEELVAEEDDFCILQDVIEVHTNKTI